MQPDEDVRAVTLASAIDFEGFRRACRALWADQVGPDRVSWSTAQDPEADLFAAAANAAAASTAPPVSVPSGFMPLCESAILHRDPSRFALLYRLLWRLQIDPALRHDTLDPDWAAVHEMAQAVRADMHPMTTSVPFRAIEDGAAGGRREPGRGPGWARRTGRAAPGRTGTPARAGPPRRGAAPRRRCRPCARR